MINGNNEECNNDIKNEERLSNGIKRLPPISSALKLDNFFDEKSDFSQVFDITELKRVRDLSMQDNFLSKLPNNMGKNLLNLTRINLSCNNLNKLDACLRSLSNLEELIIDKNRLTELPDYLGDLFHLRLISAKHNKLVIIPQNLGNLVNIQEIDLSCNNVKDIHGSWENLGKLEILNLSYNQLRSLPKCATQGSPSLEILDLSRNCISRFSNPPSSCNLKKLYLNHNPQNEEFPTWLFSEKFCKLEELVLDETYFKSFNIPAIDLPSLMNLRKLSMVQCGLADADFEKMSRSMIELEYLNAGNNTTNHKNVNTFWVMPVQNLRQPEKLEEFNIKGVGLPALPEEMNTLRNLLKLDISQNNISCLPEEICELGKLEFLNAAHNNLYALPQNIGNLTALKILFVETNRLSGLPDSIKDLEHLEYLDLYSNEFLEVPTQLNNIPNLKALDIDGNVFKTEDLEIANIEYLKARNILRSTSNLLLLRSSDPKVLDEGDKDSLDSSMHYDDDRHSNPENIPFVHTEDLSDIVSVEDWNISEDSADEYDPTTQPKTFRVCSPFTVSSVVYYGNFCPADLHRTKIMDQLVAMQADPTRPPNTEEGQFDDA